MKTKVTKGSVIKGKRYKNYFDRIIMPPTERFANNLLKDTTTWTYYFAEEGIVDVPITDEDKRNLWNTHLDAFDIRQIMTDNATKDFIYDDQQHFIGVYYTLDPKSVNTLTYNTAGVV